MNATQTSTSRRRCKRVDISTPARFQVGREIGGHATVRNVDQGGLCLQVSQAIAAGSRIVVELKTARGSVELLGYITWHRDGLAGVRVYEDEYDARIALTELMCQGLKQAADVCAMRNRHFRYVEWNRTNDPSEAPKLTAAWRRLIPQGIWNVRHATTLNF